jgi:Protein of unknown function (DUF3833)
MRKNHSPWQAKLVALATVALFIYGCGVNMASLKNERPIFLPESWFVGKFHAAGGFFDRFGQLKRRFTMSLEGRVEGDLIFLQEELRYTDGEITNRTYKIKKVRENLYEATADGVVGKASIEASGNALRWRYRLKQSIGGSEWTLTFDDWMYLIDDNTMVDRAEVSKFGIILGEVVLVATKE